MSTLTQQIEKADADIAKYSNEISTRRRLENQWRTSLKTCNQTLKKNREACERDNIDRKNKADAYANARKRSEELLEEAKSIRQQLLDLQEDKMKSESQATINLSEQGMSFEALVVGAQGQADAAILRAELEGEATLKSSTEASKSQKYVFIAVAVAIVLIGGIFAWTKFKK